MHSRIAALIAVLATTPAVADTLTENISFTGTEQNGPYFLTGNLFNPSLGTLTGVTETLSGRFDANVFVPGAGLPLQISATLSDGFGAPGQSATIGLGRFTLSQQAGDYVGSQLFDFSESVSDIDAFIAGSSNATNYLNELALYDRILPNSGAVDDFSRFSGTLSVAYTYTVPEPGSVATFGVGLLAIVGLLRKNKAFFF